MSGADKINEYALTFVLSATDRFDVPDNYIRENEFRASLAEHVAATLSSVDTDNVSDPIVVSDNIFEIMLGGGLFNVIGDEFAGDYIAYRPAKYIKYRDEYLAKSPIFGIASKVGGRFYRDVFAKVSAEKSTGQDESDDSLLSANLNVAPASNRIVTFSDNQISELDEQATSVIEAVEAKNQIDGEPGLREIFIGQLKAGRELIRAGSFRLYMLELTLVETLRFLAKRYEREAIGGLAASLIAALVKHIGIDG